jgi:hypothetical protein
MSSINIAEIEIGDIFSEISHYRYLGKKGNRNEFFHLESGKTVTLDNGYVTDLLSTADQYNQEIKVGKEDKKDGTLGIRSIWENIHSSEVFLVSFKKQDVPLTGKKFRELKEDQIAKALEAVTKAQTSKKGVLDVAKKELIAIQENPILPFEKGESRVLRGFKVQFVSRDGKYDCVDMDIAIGSNIRPVNINTIEYLIFKGVKYTVE